MNSCLGSSIRTELKSLLPSRLSLFQICSEDWLSLKRLFNSDYLFRWPYCIYHVFVPPHPGGCRVFSSMHQYGHIGYKNIEIFLCLLETMASLSLTSALPLTWLSEPLSPLIFSHSSAIKELISGRLRLQACDHSVPVQS